MAENMIPLRERISAATPVIPTHPDAAVWRPATVADIDVILATQKAMDKVDHPTWTTAREDIELDMTASHVDLERDSILGLDADGAVIALGFVTLDPGQETRVQSYLQGGVHPEYCQRGIGRDLLRWQRERSREQLASSDKALPGWSILYLEDESASAKSLAEHSGLTPSRYFAQMDRDLSIEIPSIPLADGIRIVQFSDQYVEATRIARNDSFRDHWGSQPAVRERWEQFAASEQFRADLSWLAIENAGDGSERVVAFGLSMVNEEDWVLRGKSSGYISLIGVVRDRRGLKLAPAVLAAVLESHKAAGFDLSILDVDSESPTGANTLYERMGFVATHRVVAFVDEV